MGRVKYSEFVDQIDVDALMEAIGFSPEYQDNRGNHVGYCIWPENHSNGDTTGKFAIHPEKKQYNCYVCGGGSLLSLVMEVNGWDSETAENYLRRFAGDVRTDTEFLDGFLNAFARDAEKRVETLPYFNARVLDKYEYAYEWGDEHGFDRETIRDYNVLYNPEMTKRSPGKGKFEDVPDYVGPAILWPHYWNEKLVGWQSRFLDDDRPEIVKKWVNTVDFPKENTLYGWHLIKGAQFVYVVESAKSVLKLSQNLYDVVGTFGASVNEPQLRLLRRFPCVILWPDNDSAGALWYKQAKGYLERYTTVMAVAPVTGAKSDPADLKDFDLIDWIKDNTVDVSVPLF